MAIELHNPITDNDIENAVLSWIGLLASEKYLEAYEFTLHDPYYQWTPVLMESVINGYGLPYDDKSPVRHKVTKWSTATAYNNQNYNREINLFESTKYHINQNFVEVGEVHYDLPLDGEWSDLTATFKILKSKDFTTLELNEIHVM